LSFDRTMSSRRFKVALRPRLSAITEHPKMDFVDYERRLASLQGGLQLIQQAYLGTPERAIIVLEGPDTSGKGGIVRRLGWALDPRSFRVNPVASPDEHERAQHYLQRFWRRLPEKGQIVVFDRSWYGRVLVERIEGFATETEWRRAYREINEFERVLVDSGIRLVKLFLHITRDEQRRRFRNRLIDPVKRWKLSYEDFRNRRHWPEYEIAIEDMMDETSTKRAPWHLIPANDKPYGRIAAFRILEERLGTDVSMEPRPIDPNVLMPRLSLSDEELSLLRSLAEPVAYGRRREFLQAVAAALEAGPQSGPGVLFRVAREVQRKYVVSSQRIDPRHEPPPIASVSY
jgi:AMP-polyphosphate phosphotransferase